MSFFPINIEISNRKIVVVGGGAVAERKISRIVAAGGNPIVIAPQLTGTLVKLREKSAITHLARQYQDGDLCGAFLAIAATNDKAVNTAVATEAEGCSVLADICNVPEKSSFTMPAVLTRGDLVIAVSTGGKSPALAKKIRDTLAESFGDEYITTVRLLGAVREKLLTTAANSAYNSRLLSELAAHDLPRFIKEQRYEDLDHLLLELLGPGFSTSQLLGKEKDHQ